MIRIIHLHPVRLITLGGFALLFAACAAPPPAHLASACAGMQGRVIGPERIALPSGAASIEAAAWDLAAPMQSRPNGAVTPATPDFCKLTGSIAPLDPAAPRIQFQINLPAAWNGKTLQYGGGGFNGVLITGLAALRDAPPDLALPIAQGYVTFGTDSGHQASAHPPADLAAWALNDEALVNFAYASYKKVKDVTHAVTTDFYRRAPSHSYFFGGSEGGREGLTMAQRFPADYDGIFSAVPVINLMGLNHSFIRVQQMQAAGAWIAPEKIPALGLGVARACDALDGLADGVVNNYLECAKRFDPASLRCPDGRDAGNHCLSDAQVAVVKGMYSPFKFPFQLANSIDTYPARLPGGEDHPDGWIAWVGGRAAPAHPPAAANSRQWLYGNNAIRYLVVRDAAFDVRQYNLDNLKQHEARIRYLSSLLDSTSPDLSAFFARGGRLVIRENAGDLAQSGAAGMDYFNALVARSGRATIDRHVRLYVSPASTHSGAARSVTDGSEVATAYDMLGLLDRWVTDGEAPRDALEQVAKESAPPFRIRATRPLCLYPGYPHYIGGDAKVAASYRCTRSGS